MEGTILEQVVNVRKTWRKEVELLRQVVEGLPPTYAKRILFEALEPNIKTFADRMNKAIDDSKWAEEVLAAGLLQKELEYLKDLLKR
jgi:hypothetical protein